MRIRLKFPMFSLFVSFRLSEKHNTFQFLDEYLKKKASSTAVASSKPGLKVAHCVLMSVADEGAKKIILRTLKNVKMQILSPTTVRC